MDEALNALRQEVENFNSGPDTLVRIQLSGTVRADSLPLISEFSEWLQARCDNEQLLHAEVEEDIRTSEQLAGALQQLTDGDEVIAGTVADLQSLADPDRAAPQDVAGGTASATGTDGRMDGNGSAG